jgi:hypothetical protein
LVVSRDGGTNSCELLTGESKARVSGEVAEEGKHGDAA